MKLTIISPGGLPLPPTKGGAVENLINNFLLENEKTGDNQIIVYSSYNKEAFNEGRKYSHTKFVYVNTDSLYKKFLTRIRFGLRKILKINIPNQYLSEVIKDLRKKQDHNLVIVENRPDYIIPLTRIKKIKVMLHLHNLLLNEPFKKNRDIISSVTKIVTVSNFIKNSIYESEKNNDKIVVLKNGIDIKKFDKNYLKEKVIDFKKKYSIKDDDIIILFAGRLTKSKGVLELLNAFIKIKDHSNLKLLIVGSSWFSSNADNNYIREIREKSKLIQEQIIFTGYIDYENMPVIYGSSDILVAPSIGIEAAGLIILEARSANLPVVISDSGGMPEYVNKKGSYIVKVGPNITEEIYIILNRLINDKKLRVKMSEASIEGINEFDTKKYYNEFSKILEGVYDDSK